MNSGKIALLLTSLDGAVQDLKDFEYRFNQAFDEWEAKIREATAKARTIRADLRAHRRLCSDLTRENNRLKGL